VQFTHVYYSIHTYKTAGELIQEPETSGLSYFTVQTQSWIFKTQSKSNHRPKSLWN